MSADPARSGWSVCTEESLRDGADKHTIESVLAVGHVISRVGVFLTQRNCERKNEASFFWTMLFPWQERRNSLTNFGISSQTSRSAGGAGICRTGGSKLARWWKEHHLKKKNNPAGLTLSVDTAVFYLL